MDRNALLAGGAVGVLLVAAVTAVLVPGVLADPTDEGPVRPGPVDVADVSISAGPATGETVTLGIETRIDHRRNPTHNVSVLVRAIDAESGLLTTTERVDVGTLTRDGEATATANLTVPREGGYDIEVLLFREAERVDQTEKSIRGVSAIKPPYLRSTTSFTKSEALPPVSFSIAEAGEDRTTLDLTATLTNSGDDPAEDLSVTFVLRQAESNIVASRTTVDAGTIRAGRTESVDATATVPNDYNYYIDVVLLRDGVVIDSARGAANLDPTRTISVNETTEDVELRVDDFEGGGASTPEETDYEATRTESAAPGFGVVVALVALLATAFVTRRWRR
ncbi:PGF-CTERM sorting domain-containing protein [Haloferax sp. MBLA0076]|uniref:PGF-CTERM sorting domain-containing protein n=1 Tax=Haloferax litoreum TaxID=2666140 RepID=A0A6A8GH08_9EURY|nr:MULTISPECIES: PGF-CTERM sorting domain-containing protein [Haloferax]KAB1193658.1 PGF-CTERM sorting domain-containing protein [Haloferax sp. CBA1148]MRX22186.1 PGF-CTERM sorting domain-containing protein [Haloferax litoreum]